MSIIELSALSKHYGSTLALDNIDLMVPAGEPIALVGPNGAGKTTLLSLLSGYIFPSSGGVNVLGHTPGDPVLAGKIAALPQDAQLDPRFSIQRQLEFYARLQGFTGSEAKTEVTEALEQVQMQDAAHKKPEQLSHGMRKRVSIAQMLLGKPELALLDEPTAGLDPPNVKLVREIIFNNSDKTTFIVSSHNLDEVEKLCTSVIYLSAGKLREFSPIDSDNPADACFTLRLNNVDAAVFKQAAESLAGVKEIRSLQQGDFLIDYDPAVNPEFDQSLLKMLSTQGWRYKHLINGRTLEDKLF